MRTIFIYALVHCERVMYVGSTSDIATRLAHHNSRHAAPKLRLWVSEHGALSCRILDHCKTRQCAWIIERAFVASLKPPLNTARVILVSDSSERLPKEGMPRPPPWDKSILESICRQMIGPWQHGLERLKKPQRGPTLSLLCRP